MGGLDTTRVNRPSWLTTAAFLAVLLFSEGVVRIIEPSLPPASEWGTLEEQLKFDDMKALSRAGGADVVFLGSSIVNVGIDPSGFVAQSDWAESAYNASLNAASPRLMEAWSTEVVLPLLEPEVVVIGLTSRALNGGGTNQRLAYERYFESIGRARFLKSTTLGQNLSSVAASLSALFRRRGEIRTLDEFLGDLRSSNAGPATTTSLGYETRLRNTDYEVTDSFRERMTHLVLNDYRVGGEELVALERLIVAAEAHGAQVYLIDMPVLESAYLPLHPNGQGDYEAYRAALVGLAVDHKVPMLGADDLTQNEALFADPLHLNGEGADRLVEWLAEVVQEPLPKDPAIK